MIMQRETVYDPVFDAQEHYRLLLDAMARPGTINVLPRRPLTPPAGLPTAAALVGFALLNSDITFYAEGKDAATLTRYLAVNTSARGVPKGDADFIFACGASPATLITGIKTGTLAYPEEGATLVAAVDAMAGEVLGLGPLEGHPAGIPALALTLKGPGVAGSKTFFVAGLSVALLEALLACNAEFPLGIDLVLADPADRIACIPRSSKVQFEIIPHL
jgi:alpha-D-ribose 1-methylphosphonate 5-triphosphate synthase subunit PhnH